MPYTKTNLRKDVLLELRVLPEGQEPSAQQAVDMDRKIDQSQAELLVLSVAHWELTDIPDEVQQPLIEYVAARAAFSFSATAPVNEEVALAKLRRVTSGAPVLGEPVQAEYF